MAWILHSEVPRQCSCYWSLDHTSKGLDIPDSIQPDFVKTTFNAVINFSKRKQRMCEF